MAFFFLFYRYHDGDSHRFGCRYGPSVKLPLAGHIGTFIDDCRKVCSNSWVLRVVEFGYQIPLKFIPQQSSVPINPSVSKEAHKVLLDEANDLKHKGAVSVVDHLPGEYRSSYFAVPKARSPGKFRPILNLKYFNKNVKKYKFKMETLASLHEWIREGSYCTGLDLKDAFPHIKIHWAILISIYMDYVLIQADSVSQVM